MHLAAIDLGSNSFRLQIGRVDNNSIIPETYLKEGVRIAAGLDAQGFLTEEAQQRALDALSRFSTRIKDLPQSCVRAVGTQTLRIAKNTPEFLEKAQMALGFPIEVLRGKEEARLIYLGCSHALPNSEQKRLIVDIGGGSTELAIGQQYNVLACDSFHVGCVNMTLEYFRDGKITRERFEAARLAAYAELINARRRFNASYWSCAYGSSGSMEAVFALTRSLGIDSAVVTKQDLLLIRDLFIKFGDIRNICMQDLHQSRKDVIVGGLAVLSAVFDALDIETMGFSSGALRMGVLYDLNDKLLHRDCRDASIDKLMTMASLNNEQAASVDRISRSLFSSLIPEGLQEERKCLHWAALLHEIGSGISPNGYHRHGAYIIEHADLVCFSSSTQKWLSDLILGQRGRLLKISHRLEDSIWTASLLALRLACIFAQERDSSVQPRLKLFARGARQFELIIENEDWLQSHPLTYFLLKDEARHWKAVQYTFEFKN